jgi:hypothetical protein
MHIDVVKDLNDVSFGMFNISNIHQLHMSVFNADQVRGQKS